MAEHTSCRNPGRVSCSVRVPPPTVVAASSTRTERPACSSAIAAASPLGPAPTTIASQLPALSVAAGMAFLIRRIGAWLM